MLIRLSCEKSFLLLKNLTRAACQASAERAWSAISRFYDNCRKQIKGKKGYPKYQKRCRSVEYKTSGWKLSDDKKKITFTDKNGIGSLKMKGTRDLNYFSLNQIKRVRIIKRADGYYVQFCIQEDIRCVKSNKLEPTKHCVGIDVGLNHFYVDSDNNQVKIPQYYRKAEKRLNLLNRRKSKKFRKNSSQSNNYQKARNRYARKHLRVSSAAQCGGFLRMKGAARRQREEFAKRVALSVVQSSDLIAYVGAACA
jgi:putative transposase